MILMEQYQQKVFFYCNLHVLRRLIIYRSVNIFPFSDVSKLAYVLDYLGRCYGWNWEVLSMSPHSTAALKDR